MIKLPINCPSCDVKLEWSYSETDLICPNPKCPAKVLYNIEHFCNVLGIEEMNAVTLEKLNLAKPEDLYNLTEDYISSLSSFGTKRAKTIIAQIKNSLIDVLPSKIIEAFGIPGLGSKTAENIVKFFKDNSIDKFLNADKETLISIDGCGARIADTVILMQEDCKNLFNVLKDNGLVYKKIEQTTTKLNGLKICLTGASPDKRSRFELSKILESHGAEIQNSVNKKTNILVAENINGNSSKLKKARELGIKIVTYQEFFKDL